MGNPRKFKALRLNIEYEEWLKHLKIIFEDAWWPLPAFHVSRFETLQFDSDARTIGFAI